MLYALLALMSVGVASMVGGGSDDEEPVATPTDESDETGSLETLVADLIDALVEEPQDDPVLGAGNQPTNNLVNVLDADGNIISEAAVLTEGPTTGEGADRDFIITPPQGAAAQINVAYDPQTTFQIDITPETHTVYAALNSDITVPDPVIQTVTQEVENDDGTTETVTIESSTYSHNTFITLDIEDAHIGHHVAQIDLSNPGDTLEIEFPRGAFSNLHFITHDMSVYDEERGITTSDRTGYLIETGPEIDQLDPDQLKEILVNGGNAQSGTLLAQVYLGYDAVDITDEGTIIYDYLNEAPQMWSPASWATLIVDTDNQSVITYAPTPEAEDPVDQPTPSVPAGTPVPTTPTPTTPSTPTVPTTPTLPTIPSIPDIPGLPDDLLDPLDIIDLIDDLPAIPGLPGLDDVPSLTPFRPA